MANSIGKIKNGMAGSKGGRSRKETTEVLKKVSKKVRRSLDKLAAHEEKEMEEKESNNVFCTHCNGIIMGPRGKDILFCCPGCAEKHEYDKQEKLVKMYILIHDRCDTGHAINTAAHCGKLVPAHWSDEDSDPDVREWWDTSFRTVTCKVTDKEFKKAQTYDDFFTMTELHYDNDVVALVFKPRREWPRFFNFLKMWS